MGINLRLVVFQKEEKSWGLLSLVAGRAISASCRGRASTGELPSKDFYVKKNFAKPIRTLGECIEHRNTRSDVQLLF